MRFLDWLRWVIHGHKRFASLCVQYEALHEAFHQECEAVGRLREKLIALREDHDEQLAQLRAIVTTHAKDQPPPMRQARRMSEIRNVLAANESDEDAA